jgi:hypothetical protein
MGLLFPAAGDDPHAPLPIAPPKDDSQVASQEASGSPAGTAPALQSAVGSSQRPPSPRRFFSTASFPAASAADSQVSASHGTAQTTSSGRRRRSHLQEMPFPRGIGLRGLGFVKLVDGDAVTVEADDFSGELETLEDGRRYPKECAPP